MQKIYFILLFSVAFCCTSPVFAHISIPLTLGAELPVNYTIVERSEACTIFLVEENGFSYYSIVSVIAAVFLPEAIYGFCIKTVDNPEVCDAVYDVSEALVGFNLINGGIRKGTKWALKSMSSGMGWKAEVRNEVGIATIEASTYKVASLVKEVFNAYRKFGFRWEKPDIIGEVPTHIPPPTCASCRMYLINDTPATVYFELSHDGSVWKEYALQSGYKQACSFWKGSSQHKREEGYIRIQDCTFRLQESDEYLIKWDESESTYKVTRK